MFSLITQKHQILNELKPERFEELDKLFLDENQKLISHPASVFHNIPNEELRVWCHANSIYQLPTTELLEFISENITGKAIEIGAGNGCIGRALGIPITDSCLQEKNIEVRDYYHRNLQPTIKYPDDVNLFQLITLYLKKRVTYQI